MTYLQFHLMWTLPLLALGLFLVRGFEPAVRQQMWRAIGFVVVMAVVYTTPWDNYLVYRGVWTYPPERVWFTLGYVPIEEYAFFVLMSVVTGLFTSWLRGGTPSRAHSWSRSWAIRIGGAMGALVVGLWGLWGLWCGREDSQLYLGLILVWVAPVVAFHWLYGGDWIVRHVRLWATAIALPTVVFGVADLFAIRQGIWAINPHWITGVNLWGLPLEEALFFFSANVLVVQGILLWSL